MPDYDEMSDIELRLAWIINTNEGGQYHEWHGDSEADIF